MCSTRPIIAIVQRADRLLMSPLIQTTCSQDVCIDVQAGSCIVETLRMFRQPVTVYLPPRCELRGGAWVVLDSQINADMIETYAGVLPSPVHLLTHFVAMHLSLWPVVAPSPREHDAACDQVGAHVHAYFHQCTTCRLHRDADTDATQCHLLGDADPTARGSVLEAEGVVEIKFRDHEVRALAQRLDPVARDLQRKLDRGAGSGAAPLESALAARLQHVLPVYRSVALQYAAMHETPVRTPSCCPRSN